MIEAGYRRLTYWPRVRISCRRRISAKIKAAAEPGFGGTGRLLSKPHRVTPLNFLSVKAAERVGFEPFIPGEAKSLEDADLV